MCGYEVDRSTIDVRFYANHSAALFLARVCVAAVVDCHDRKARENCDAVLSTLVLKVVSKSIFHAREFRDFGNLIDALCPLNAAINLLQTDKVRMLLIDHLSNAL